MTTYTRLGVIIHPVGLLDKTGEVGSALIHVLRRIVVGICMWKLNYGLGQEMYKIESLGHH